MKKQKKLIIFGNKKLAELACFYFTNDSEYEVEAFCVDSDYIKEERFMNLPVIPFEKIEDKYPPSDFDMFVAIGYKKQNKIRADKYHEVKNKGYKLATYVCSKSVVWPGVKIGENCFILENQILQPDVVVGNDVVIWGNSHFGHNTVISDHCWISPHAAVCGGVHIGEYSFLGTNITIRDNLKIGKECVVGAGSLVLHDIKDKEVFIGKVCEKYPLDSEQFGKMMNISREY